MLEFEQDLEFKTISKLKFWSPPFEYKIPQPPPGHIYIPLRQGCTKAIYNSLPFSSYQTFFELITEENFKKIIESANFVIKTPYRKYGLVKGLLLGLIIQSVIRITSAVLTGDIINFIIFTTFLIYSPILMRYGGGQYLTRMKKYEKVLNKALGYQSNSRLSNSGIVVEAGKMCLWLDFHTGNYEPPIQLGNTEPIYFEPGSQIILK